MALAFTHPRLYVLFNSVGQLHGYSLQEAGHVGILLIVPAYHPQQMKAFN